MEGASPFRRERRFDPWLTVIAGNICTDMLRRRTRSTPTDHLELTAQQPVGVVAEDTSEDLVLAAVDGELVNRALERLSTRHRDVLAMREGSGWTYQQIADHEGVEIGTIETLLWRARQALKREFAAVSESKGALAGFLATGAFFRRSIFRLAHRGANVHPRNGNGGGLRDAMSGLAVTGAAVAAAIAAPIALLDAPSQSAPTPPPASSTLADPPLVVGGPTAATAAARDTGTIGGGGTPGATSGSPTGANAAGSGGLSGGLNQAAGGIDNAVHGVTNTVGGAVGGITNGLGDVANGAGGALGGVSSGVSTTTNGAVNGAPNPISGMLGGVTPGLSGGASTTTTAPLGGVAGTPGETVTGLLGGG